jgi:hypothetical protein
VTADKSMFLSAEDRTRAEQHVNAVLASGYSPRTSAHLLETRNRIEEAVTRKSREEPRPLRGSADVPTV